MPNQYLKLRRSSVPGKIPTTSSLDFGEVALNTYDGLAFMKKSGSSGEEIITLGSTNGAFTGSFSGSFTGNGSGLTNIPASGITGLNLSRIATGSVTASVDTGTGSFIVTSGSSTFLSINNSGNVNISELTVVGSSKIYLKRDPSTLSLPIIYGYDSANSEMNRIVMYDQNDGGLHIGAKRSTAVIAFDVGAGSYTERMRIISNGNVLIGTTTDNGYRLDVSGSGAPSGSLRIVGNSYFAGNVGIKTASPSAPIHISNGTDQNESLIRIDDYATNTGVLTISNHVTYPGSGNNYSWRINSGVVTGNLHNISFDFNGTTSLFLNKNRNIGIGTTVDSGYRLEINGSGTSASGSFRAVSGSALIVGLGSTNNALTVASGSTILQGAGSTSATSTLTILNSSAQKTVNILGDHTIYVGPTNTTDQLVIVRDSNAASLRIAADRWGSIGTNLTLYGKDNTTRPGSAELVSTFSPSSGTTQYWGMLLSSTINQTGGANGITRGLYVNPTLTSAADWRSIEWSNNTGWGLYGSGSAPNYLAGPLTASAGISGSITNAVYALTASSADDFLVRGTLTAQTIVSQVITSSTDFVTGSTRFGSALGNTHQFTGSVSMTGSLSVFDKVGIGTNAPDNPITINVNSNLGQGVRVVNSSAGSLGRAHLFVENNVGETAALAIWGTGTGLPNKTVFGAGKDFLIGTDANVASGGTSKFQIFVGGYNAATSPQFTMHANGNVNIGTTTDSGYRLDVNGTSRFSNNMLITGSGGAAYALTATNGWVQFGSTTGFTWDNTNNRVGIGTNTPSYALHVIGVAGISSNLAVDGYMYPISTGNSNTFRIHVGGTAVLDLGYYTGAQNTSSGIKYMITAAPTFNPSAGVATFIGYGFSPTINQSGTATGITYGVYINPTLTSAADWRSLSWSNNSGWGLYGAGSAPSYLAGRLSIGTTVTGSALTVYKSGSTVVDVQGSTGQLFSVVDSMTGSLMSVNDISGIPLLSVNSNGAMYMNSALQNSITSSYVVYSIDSNSGNAAYFDYRVFSPITSGSRAGTLMAVWFGSSVEYTDTSTNDLIADTSGISLSADITGSLLRVNATVTTGSWNVKIGARII